MKIEDILTEEQRKDLERIRRCNERGVCIGCDMNDDDFCIESAYSIINALITALESVPTTTKRDDFVYICSPYAGYVDGNVERARKYAGAVWREGKVPIATHLYFPQFAADESDVDRERAINICEILVGICSEIRVFGNCISDGMKREITAAIAAGVPVRWCEA